MVSGCTKRGCRKCDGIECPQLRRANQYTPPGQCCPVCRPIGKPDCSRVHCLHRYCVGQYTPPGECCPVCPRNTY
ncbi:uncharacterized protein DDB_G0274171-like [Mercenaria mercenaria]|uniref:uncharacterized protein DDB_G0274171-like n=1 Tax=Mercenaria mercenaria TaxID=6596 RepID=UPI00234E6191|nr:uncharacterized protein DDB_G0274171-like [Mercenaria mercenaria]